MLKGNYIGGYVLFGYDIVNKKYVINEKESSIVKQIFEDYSNGKKAQEIDREKILKKIYIILVENFIVVIVEV